MKKRLWIIAGLAAAASVCGAATVAMAVGAPEKEAETALEEDLAESGYVLVESEGGIGVYHMGERIMTLDVDVSGLRAADRKLLSDGIEVGTYEELLGLLEDFSS